MSLSSARIAHTVDVPVHSWKFTSLIQAFTYAKDPLSLREYVFAVQTRELGTGDVEDVFFHRHLWTGTQLKYLDTMTGRRFGHTQSLHVRFSATGKPWIWFGVESYDSRGRTSATRVARFLYRPDFVLTPNSSDFRFINVGTGTTLSPISCPAGKIVIRRARSVSETYTEFNESDLLEGRVKPLRSMTRAKIGPGPYQGSCATTKSIFVVNGTTNRSQKIRQHDWRTISSGTLDISNLRAPTGPNTSDEPEGLAIVRGVLHVGKRFNSTDRRIYALFGLRW